MNFVFSVNPLANCQLREKPYFCPREKHLLNYDAQFAVAYSVWDMGTVPEEAKKLETVTSKNGSLSNIQAGCVKHTLLRSTSFDFLENCK